MDVLGCHLFLLRHCILLTTVVIACSVSLPAATELLQTETQELFSQHMLKVLIGILILG